MRASPSHLGTYQLHRPVLALSALCVAMLMATSSAEARRLRLGGWKSSPGAPVPASSHHSASGKGSNTLVVIPAVSSSKASAQEANPDQKRQIMPTRVEPPPVVRAEAPTGPLSAVPVLGATAGARPAPSGFAALN